MGPIAARGAWQICHALADVLAIELMCGAQGLDFLLHGDGVNEEGQPVQTTLLRQDRGQHNACIGARSGASLAKTGCFIPILTHWAARCVRVYLPADSRVCDACPRGLYPTTLGWIPESLPA